MAEYLAQYPFTIFLWHIAIGIILCLLVITTSIARETSDKSFSSYAIYLVCLVCFLFTKGPYFYDTMEYLRMHYNPLLRLLQVLAFIFHVQFVFHFLNLLTLLPSYSRNFQKVVRIGAIISIIVSFACQWTRHQGLYEDYFYGMFMPAMTVLVAHLLYKIKVVKSSLKIYFFWGVGFYSFCVLLSGLFSYRPFTEMISFRSPSPMAIYYVGLIFELIYLSLGLAFKVKRVYENKVLAEQNLRKVQKEQYLILEKELANQKQKLNYQFDKNTKLLKKQIELEYDNNISQLEMKSLRSQMNPHFIFNTLNSIKVYIIENEPQNAILYLTKFSKLIRRILSESNREETTLEEELEFIKLYVSIENIRFDHAIHYQVNNDSGYDLSKVKMPPMILQPFIENAIWHGLASPDISPKELSINIISMNGSCHFTIEDNGVGRKKAKEKKSTLHKRSFGLKITNDRLQHFYSQTDYPLVDVVDLYHGDQPAGTQVHLRFPIVSASS